jgi:hypothetical protein
VDRILPFLGISVIYCGGHPHASPPTPSDNTALAGLEAANSVKGIGCQRYLDSDAIDDEFKSAPL